MKRIKFGFFFLVLFIFTACAPNNRTTDILNVNDNNKEEGLTTNSANLDPKQKVETINKLDISVFNGTVPADLQEMLVYGEFNLNDQVIYLSDISEFGMDDDEINDYGLWHDSINRVFCGIEEQSGGSIKGILTSPDGDETYFNSSIEINQIDGEGYCIGFNISALIPGGPYEFYLDIPEIRVRDIFNVYIDTLIIRNWEPNEKIRIITYSHEAPLYPTGNFYSETYFNANQNGELWIEIVDPSNNSMWENNLIAILMHGESGKVSELFAEKDYSNIEEMADYPSGD